MEKTEDITNQNINTLLENAKNEILNINSDAKGKKKRIILELAASLEGKFREDTIAMVIAHELKGITSERFIHECLPEKYKQKHRVENAKKQRQKVEKKLDGVQPLKEIEEEEKTKQPMLVNIDGSTSIQNHDDGELDIGIQDLTTSNSFESSIYYPNQQQQSLQEEKNHEEEINEYPNFKETPSSESQNPNDDQDLDQLISTDGNNVTSENKNKIIPSNNMLDLEFSMPFDRIQKHMVPLFSKIGRSGLIWFHIKVNTKKSEIVYYDFGRIGGRNDAQVGI